MNKIVNSIKDLWNKVPPRYKNYVFWGGLLAVICNAMDVSPEMFTSWPLLWDALVALVNNPFQLGCVILAIAGVWANPNTPGLGDHEHHQLNN